MFARIIGQKLNEQMGQPVVVDNRPGATGNIGAELVAKATPDGYTLFNATLSLAISPAFYSTLSFDPVKSFAPITQIASVPLVLVAHPGLPARTVQDFVSYAKSNPGKLNYASVGAGSPQHLSAELLASVAGLKLVHVPYKSGGAMATAVLQGETQIGLPAIAPALPHVKAGRLRAIAVTASKRSSALPDTPTFAEAGFPAIEADNWNAILAPAGTPRSVIEKLHVEINKAARLADVVEQFARQGAEVNLSTPAALGTLMKTEVRKWGQVAHAAGVQRQCSKVVRVFLTPEVLLQRAKLSAQSSGKGGKPMLPATIASNRPRRCANAARITTWIAVLTLLCAWTAPAVASLVVEEKGYRLSVQVVPRLGAFNRLIYEESFDGQCAARPAVTAGYKDWSTYWRSIAPELQTSLARATKSHVYPQTPAAPVWDMLATRTPAFPKNYNVSANCGYGVRRVFFKVDPPAGRAIKCEFRVIGKAAPKVQSAGDCSGYVPLRSNLEETVEVRIADPANKGSPVVMRGKIPEDFLIVSLGDWYASGEGNPDAPSGLIASVKWMDPWCHRSAFAGPIQAGLRLMEDPTRIANARVRNAMDAGAITIVSFACSGARVSAGLNGNYEGARGWEDFAGYFVPHIYKLERSGGLGDPPAMERQLMQLRSLVESQSPDAQGDKKFAVDVLLLSGGGNDARFAPLVKKILTSNVGPKEKQAEINNQLGAHFQTLTDEYATFVSNLNTLETLNGKRIRYHSGLVTLYPDPTFRAPGQDCDAGATAGNDSVLEKALEKAASLVHVFKISGAETAFIRQHILGPLNETVRKASSDWLPLSLHEFDKVTVQNHGWCKAGSSGYAEQERWFRQVADSVTTQGNINGSYHPTWQFNRELAGQIIARSIIAAVNEEPRWSAIAITPLHKRSDGVVFTSATPRFAYSGKHDETLKLEIVGNKYRTSLSRGRYRLQFHGRQTRGPTGNFRACLACETQAPLPGYHRIEGRADRRIAARGGV